ncbi:MAG: DUF4031 domain-containing protein [Planctomycetaceae bacterium]
MTVFVDNYEGRFGRMIMCHMMSDANLEELHAMADAIGLRRAWFQSHGSAPHYDVCKSRRQEAIARGAVELSIRSEEWRRVYRAAKQLKTDSGR